MINSLDNPRWFSACLAVFGGIIWAVSQGLWPSTNIVSGVLGGSLLQVSAILIGFVGTALTILLALKKSSVVKFLTAAGAFDSLLGIFLLALALGAMAVIANVIAVTMFASGVSAPKKYVVHGIWMACNVGAGASTYSAVRVLVKLLRDDEE